MMATRHLRDFVVVAVDHARLRRLRRWGVLERDRLHVRQRAVRVVKTFARRVARYRALSSRQRRDLHRALALIPLVALSLRIGRYASVVSVLERTSRRAGLQPVVASPDEGRAIADMVALASGRGLVRGNCLHRSLVTWWLLRRRGVPAVIRLGAAKAPTQGVAFHAWVEYDSEVVNDRPDVVLRFAAFPVDAAAPLRNTLASNRGQRKGRRARQTQETEKARESSKDTSTQRSPL